MTHMTPLYHCPCEPATSAHAYHPLPTLYFCDECDSVRCRSCVTEEVASYYCPNCLFEVPQASVRAERNRCARNCFVCPCCANTLSVLASDPALSNGEGPSSTAASVGEPPYYLACQACRWDSKSSLPAPIVFEKPTGLAGQLARMEEAQNLPSLSSQSEYERIREHLEPYVKAGAAAAAAAGKETRKQQPTTAIAAAARALSHSSSAMAKDIPSSIASASRFNSLHNLATRSGSGAGSVSRSAVAATASGRDDLPSYVSKQAQAQAQAKAAAKGKQREQKVVLDEEAKVQAVRTAKRVYDLPSKEQRWTTTYGQPRMSGELRPQRLPLQSKRTKRCHVCRHIVVKPDPKAASTKFKICLVASNYLPAITVHRRVPPSLTSRISAAGSAASASASASRRSGRPSTLGTSAGSAAEQLIVPGSAQDLSEPLRPGRNYSFQLTFVNPLFESIEVFVELAEPLPEGAEEGEKRKWQASMPAGSFAMDAFAEAWEYEDEDEDEQEKGKGKRMPPGVLGQKLNRTIVQLDLVTGREASGSIHVPLLITFTYTAEDPPTTGAAAAAEAAAESTTGALKSFSFWASIPLGTVVPRPTAAPPATSSVGRSGQADSVRGGDCVQEGGGREGCPAAH